MRAGARPGAQPFAERRPVVSFLVLVVCLLVFALAVGTALGHVGVHAVTMLLDLVRPAPDVP